MAGNHPYLTYAKRETLKTVKAACEKPLKKLCAWGLIIPKGHVDNAPVSAFKITWYSDYTSCRILVRGTVKIVLIITKSYEEITKSYADLTVDNRL